MIHSQGAAGVLSVICQRPAPPEFSKLATQLTLISRKYIAVTILQILPPATNIGKILLNSPPSINWFKARATSGCNLFITSSRSYQCHQGNLFSVTLFELDVFRLNVQQMTTGLCTHGVFRYQLILGLVSIHWIDFIKYKLLFLLKTIRKTSPERRRTKGKITPIWRYFMRQV